MTYPPEPWHLRGQMNLSVWLVPRTALAVLPVEPTVRPVLVGGRAVVGTAWVRYEPGGTLHYHELLSAVLVHERYRPRVSIVDIWVDSVASRDGGRRLWGIPKDLAELAIGPSDSDGRSTVAAEATVSGTPVARSRFTAGLRLPGQWPTPMAVSQLLDGAVKTTRVRGRAGLRFGGSRWDVAPDGPLGYLAGRRPWMTVTIADFRLTFGAAPSDPPAASG